MSVENRTESVITLHQSARHFGLLVAPPPQTGEKLERLRHLAPGVEPEIIQNLDDGQFLAFPRRSFGMRERGGPKKEQRTTAFKDSVERIGEKIGAQVVREYSELSPDMRTALGYGDRTPSYSRPSQPELPPVLDFDPM